MLQSSDLSERDDGGPMQTELRESSRFELRVECELCRSSPCDEADMRDKLD